MPQPQEVALNTLPFWSRFTLDVDLRFDGVNPTRTIFQTGFAIPVFDYRKGERNVTALGGASATARDTILVQANQTRGGGLFRIFGLSFTKDGWPFFRGPQVTPPGLEHTLFPPFSVQPVNGAPGFNLVLSPEDFRALDSLMAEIFLKYFRTEIRIDGTRRILEMGPTILYPGVGGPKGTIDTTNGDTFVSNYMPIREGIVWNPAGTVDSQLQVFLESGYACTLPTWTAPDGLFNGVPIVNANPTGVGRIWTQGWVCNFHGQEESPTSNVS